MTPNRSSTLAIFGRAGYAAQGLVYLVIGTLAARAAFGTGGGATDPRGALRAIEAGPLGTVVLALVATGLFGYMAWRIVAAITDAEREGDRPTGLAKRGMHAGRGVLYGALGADAVRLLGQQRMRGGNAARDWSARLLELPYGAWLVAATGLGVIAYGCYEAYRASSARRVRRDLDFQRTSAAEAEWIVRFGRFGIAARAVVFMTIGVLLLRAARASDPGEAGGVAASLRTLEQASYGGVVFATVAVGLVAYGVHQLATARYRRIRS